MRKFVTPGLMLAAALSLSACETIKGAGRDLQTAGHVVSSEAAKVQAGM